MSSLHATEEQEGVTFNATAMRTRLDEVAMNCEKCELFDVGTIHRDINGRFMVGHLLKQVLKRIQVLHPQTLVSFFERSIHYTPYGRRFIEPAFAELRSRFEKL